MRVILLLHDSSDLISLLFLFKSHVVLFLDLVQILESVIILSLSFRIIKSLVTNISVIYLNRSKVVVGRCLEVFSQLQFFRICLFHCIVQSLQHLVSLFCKTLNCSCVAFFNDFFLFESNLLSFSDGNFSVILLQILLLFQNFQMRFSLLLGFGTLFTVLVVGVLLLLFEAFEFCNSGFHDFQVCLNLVHFFKRCAKSLVVEVSELQECLLDALQL